MFRITNRAPFFTALGVLAIVSSAVMTGCANKVSIKPQAQANFLQYGTYRSKVETAPGKPSGLYLQLNGNGRFTMSTLAGGCFVFEDSGAWSATQEELNLNVQKSRSRESCTSAWQTVQHDMAFHCSMRNVTDRSFQMLHDEIQQGTAWTAWERVTVHGFADLDRMRMEPANDAVTLDAGADADVRTDKSVPGKNPADAIRKP